MAEYIILFIIVMVVGYPIAKLIYLICKGGEQVVAAVHQGVQAQDELVRHLQYNVQDQCDFCMRYTLVRPQYNNDDDQVVVMCICKECDT